MKKNQHRKLNGRYLVTVGALALIALCGYELWVRLEDFRAWTAGIWHLSEVQGTPFLQNMRTIFEVPEMRDLGLKLLFLAGAFLFALLCLIRRARAHGAWVLMALDLALACCGWAAGLYKLELSNLLQLLKLLPLAAIFAGFVINYIHRSQLKKRKHHHHHHDEADDDEGGPPLKLPRRRTAPLLDVDAPVEEDEQRKQL